MRVTEHHHLSQEQVVVSMFWVLLWRKLKQGRDHPCGEPYLLIRRYPHPLRLDQDLGEWEACGLQGLEEIGDLPLIRRLDRFHPCLPWDQDGPSDTTPGVVHLSGDASPGYSSGMPIYHPNPPRLAMELRGERDVLSRLRVLPTNTHVFCNLKILDPKTGKDREIDFLVLHPEMGILIIEVKGGRLVFRGEGWCRIHEGQEEPLRESPGEQLHAQQYLLMNLLKSDVRFVPRITRILVLPHMDVAEGASFGPDLPPSRILDRGKLETFPVSLRQAVAGGESWEGFEKGRAFKDHQISPEVMETLVSVLTPTIVPPPTLEEILEGEGQVQDQAARPVLKHLASNFAHGRFHVLGAPGSGKSLLSRMVARDLASQGRKVLVLAFNRALTYASQVDMDGLAGIDVATYHDFAMVQLHELGLKPSPMGTLQTFFTQELPQLFLQNVERMKNRWDALVIDEAQDLQAEWIPPLMRLLCDPEWDPILLLEDPSQNLYGRGRHALGTTWRLDLNLRQNPTLRRAVWETLPACGWDPPEEAVEPGVLKHRKTSVERWKSDLQEELQALADEGVRPSQVLVLLPHRPDRFGLKDGQKMGPWRLNTEKDWWEVQDEGRVRLNTVHAFKGLEADVVVYLAPSVKAEDLPMLRYTALSRARHRAVILEKALPPIEHEEDNSPAPAAQPPLLPKFDPKKLIAPQREALTSALKAARDWKG